MYKSLILIILAALSGCATSSVYFKGDGEKAINSERLRIRAPSLYGATKQDIEWLKLAATSNSEFSGMFIFAIPILLADIPISSVSDSIALLSPKTWENQNRRGAEISRGGPYIFYINTAYKPSFESRDEFEEFLTHLIRNSGKIMGGVRSELWLHGFKCDQHCSFHKPSTYKRYAEVGNCTQEQRILLKREWHFEIEYDLSLEVACH